MGRRRSNYIVRIFKDQNQAVSSTQSAINTNFETISASALPLKCTKCLIRAGEMAIESEMSRKRSNFNVRIFGAQNHAIQRTQNAKNMNFQTMPASALPLKCKKCLIGAGEMARESEMSRKRSNFDVRIFGAQNHAIQITIRAKNRNFQTTPASALTLKCKKCLVGAGEMARESEMSRKRSNFNVRIFRAQNHAIQITIRAKNRNFQTTHYCV